MKISVIVPCYNEEEALPFFMRRFEALTEGLPGYAFELLLVDDGSSDGTLAQANAYAAQNACVKILSFSRNFGKEAALMAGLTHASGDLVTVMDADLQDPPELLTEMLAIMDETHCDCVAARRVSREGEPPVRSLFARTFYKLINLVSPVYIAEGVRDFRLMRRDMVDAILLLCERRRFIKGIFAWVGFDVRYIDFENVERVAGNTKWSFWGLLRYALEGFFGLTTFPLALPFLMGSLTWLAGLILLCFAQWFAAGICAGSGLILLLLGLSGQYIARIYWEVKKRPLYIIKERQGL